MKNEMTLAISKAIDATRQSGGFPNELLVTNSSMKHFVEEYEKQRFKKHAPLKFMGLEIQVVEDRQMPYGTIAIVRDSGDGRSKNTNT